MATREEQLKKINAELERMSDDELDKVAGGYLSEDANDSRFLNVLLHGTTKYHQCDRYGEFMMFWSSRARKDLTKAWSSLGIEMTYSNAGNEYKLNGNKISRNEAWAHAESLVGKHLTEAQWNW